MGRPLTAESSDTASDAPRAGRALSAEHFERLAPYLTESVSIVDAEGRVRAMLGPPGGALGLSDLLGRHIFDYCLEEDVPRAVELAVEALNSSPGWTTTWVTRLRRVDGSAAEFEIHIENHQDDPVIDGFVLRLRPLPESVDAHAPLFERELGNELERLAGTVPLPILFLSSDGSLYFQNEAGKALCAGLGDQLRDEGFAAIAAEVDRAAVQAAVNELATSPGERTVTFQMAPDGSAAPRMLEAKLSGLGQGDRVLALVATLVDVTDRLAEEHELRRRANSDPLTGLLNRNELDRELGLRLVAAATSTTACYLDLDGFKAVNDLRGHQAGDELLVAVAQILTDALPPGSVAARIGGDEFVAVVCTPGADPDELAGRIDDAVRAHARALGLELSASIGSASGQAGDTPLDLLRRADRAMYEVKRTRRRPA